MDGEPLEAPPEQARDEEPTEPLDAEEAERRRKAVITAIEETATEMEGDYVLGSEDDAFLDEGRTETWHIPTGRHDGTGADVCLAVTVRDPGMNAEAVAVEIARFASDPVEHQKAILRMWKCCVVEPQSILVDPWGEAYKEEVSEWSKRRSAFEAEHPGEAFEERKPRSFLDTSTAFQANLTVRLQAFLGIDARFTERLLRKMVSPEALRRATKLSMKSPSPTASTGARSRNVAERARAKSMTHTPTPGSERTGSKETSSPSPTSLSTTASPASPSTASSRRKPIPMR